MGFTCHVVYCCCVIKAQKISTVQKLINSDTKVNSNFIFALTGCMLGDGHIRHPSPAGTARYSMTMGVFAQHYMQLLKSTVFNPFCTDLALGQWPNINLPQHIGKFVSQYTFGTRMSQFFALAHSV